MTPQPSVKERICATIYAEGPIPFERFMDIALYSPGGFFAGAHVRSHHGGDFLTSPEVSAHFGETLARWVQTEHERIGDPFQLVEVGAGSGSLMKALLGEYSVPALAVEASPAARRSLSAFVDVSPDLPESFRGVVLANELLDNLPMALAQKVDGAWRERWVGVDDDSLFFVDTPPRPEVLEWLDLYSGPVSDGGWVEVQLRARAWLTDVYERLAAGSVVIFDYGDTAENLLSRRADGTLRTYRSHHLGPHPLDEPGETDITADVNFTALLDISPSSDLLRQDDFLASLGLRDTLTDLRNQELEAARNGDTAERLRLRSAKTEIETLLHPRGLGDFRVLVLNKGTERSSASS